MTKQNDPDKTVYLHVVPDTMQPFNAVTTCADDFELAKHTPDFDLPLLYDLDGVILPI